MMYSFSPYIAHTFFFIIINKVNNFINLRNVPAYELCCFLGFGYHIIFLIFFITVVFGQSCTSLIHCFIFLVK